MKIIISEKQFKNVVNILVEKYIDDPYFRDNDIYDYIPSNKEIENFNRIDNPKPFRVNNNDDYNKNYRLHNHNYSTDKPIKLKKEVPNSGVKYTGRAKIIYTYPNGRQEDVKNSIGPVAVVKNKLRELKKQVSTKDAPFYSIKYEIVGRLFEGIHASEAHDDFNSIKTIVDGKINVAIINIDYNDNNVMKLIGKNKLKLLKVPSNKFNMYIIYRDGYIGQAQELKSLADKYNGYLSHNASDEDTIRIGKLLGYYDEDINSFIEKRKRKLT